jgi:hypothetical protein
MRKSLAVAALLLLSRSTAFADQILVLSGGAAPMANHYSQYLQTKTLTENLKTQFPRTEITTMFGAGNIEGQKPVLADVHRATKGSNGLSVETQIPGFIAKNRPATHAEVAKYFSEPSRAQMSKSETLFMFIGDHGMPNVLSDGSSDSSFNDNCINLWGFTADLASERYQIGDMREQCLSKTQLKSYLDKKVPAGRVVYAMSQCYSGGFHKMSVTTPGGYPSAENRVCGFTAITEDTTASGCTADVDGPGYQGYERSFTEQLTGIDVVSGRKLRAPKPAVLDAHRAAALEDKAKDIPLSTSDFFLWKWALALESGVRPRAGSLTASQAHDVVESSALGRDSLQDPAYKSKETFVSAMTKVFAQLYPQESAKLQGSLADLRELEGNFASKLQLEEIQLSRLGNTLANAEAALLQKWNAQVRSGTSNLNAVDTRLELNFFGALDQQYGYGAADQTALLNLSVISITRPQDAAALSAYKAKRTKLALEWALSSGDPRLASLAKNIANVRSQYDRGSEIYGDLQSAQGHARRLLIYRQGLGAWQALAKMQDTKALAELRGLLDCESASLK